MFNYLEKLRQKSDKEKRRIALLISFFFAAVIFFIWVTAIFPGFLEEKQIDDKVANIEPSPISTFEDILSQSSSAIADQFSKIKSAGASLFGAASAVSVASTTTK